MKTKYLSFAIITLISIITLMPMISSNPIPYTQYPNEYTLMKWAEWNENSNIGILTEDTFNILSEIGYSCGATFFCHTPYLYNTTTGQLERIVWVSNYARPVKCVWEYYDPTMHLIYKVEKKPSLLLENVQGYKYLYADDNSFVIPALFLGSRYGYWHVRTYFIFEDGTTGGEGPVVDDEGNSYLLQFKVVKGSWYDLIFTAPIYIFGAKTVPLFWWLSPIWIFLIFFIILAIYTRSITGAVRAIKGAVRATQEAKREWRR